MPVFIIAHNMWFLNISDLSPVNYRILAMLQEWVCQHPVQHVDKPRQRLTDRRSLIKQLIGGDLACGHELWPDMDILNIWHSPMFNYCITLLVHTFSYFMWYFIQMLETIMVMFELTWRNWCRLWHMKACYVSQGIINILFKRFCYKFIGVHVYWKLPKSAWFDKGIAELQWCSFFYSQCIHLQLLWICLMLIRPVGY